MKFDYIQVIGVLMAITAVMIALITISQHSFPLFKYAESRELINIREDIGEKSGIFLWRNRSLDLIIQSFILLVSALGCVALFRAKR
ncbi:MAG: hypothetical protein DRN68_01955 [Thaumarchaeota archaeon]|nr:MAG: hypothetical protein DRN68_01955 [Nitrososphaerota archaeon]